MDIQEERYETGTGMIKQKIMTNMKEVTSVISGFYVFERFLPAFSREMRI